MDGRLPSILLRRSWCFTDRELCDAWNDLLVIGAIEALVVTAALTSLVLAIRRIGQVVEIVRQPTRTISHLALGDHGRTVELRGRVGTSSPRMAPLSGVSVAALVVRTVGHWQLPSSGKRRETTTTHVEKHLTDLVLDDGTGQIRLRIDEPERGWSRSRQVWTSDEAPEWVRERVPPLEGGTLGKISVQEEFLPIETEVFVTGRLIGPDELEAEFITPASERGLRRSLAAEGLIATIVFLGSCVASAQLVEPVSEALREVSDLSRTTASGVVGQTVYGTVLAVFFFVASMIGGIVLTLLVTDTVGRLALGSTARSGSSKNGPVQHRGSEHSGAARQPTERATAGDDGSE
ncbi:MAG: hypothetical protein RMH81_02200 [Thermomicrobium sp.]|nr:hypothetical protein [Thermomicrobium sp.]